MKTIKAFATEHNYNKQTVYLRLKRLQKLNPEEELYKKYGNKFVFTDIGLEMLEQDLKEDPLPTIEPETNSSTDSKPAEKKKTQTVKADQEQNYNPDIHSELLIEIEKLKGKLATSEKEIEQLNIRINEKDTIINDYRTQMNNLNNYNLVLVDSLRANKALLTDYQNKEKEKEIEEVIIENDSDPAEVITEVEPTPEEVNNDSDLKPAVKRKGILGWIQRKLNYGN